MKKCVCCLRKLQLQKDCSGGNQSNNFKFVCLLSGSFQMDRAAFAYIIPLITMWLLWLPFITSSMLV